MGDIPFPEVLIHGIVRDQYGRKMSKSLGNGVDPLDVIKQYGADSLRFSLTQGISPGGDTRYIDEKTQSARNFMNKLWNASRFVLMNAEGVKVKQMGSFRLTVADKWILSGLNRTIKDVTAALNKYELGLANAKLYDFVWSQFCDWYIELSKTALYGGDEDKKANTVTVLLYVLENILKLMHPFVPFITEEIYQHLPTTKGTIMLSPWPQYEKKYTYSKERTYFENVMEAIRAIRNMKAEKGVAPSKKVNIHLVASPIKEKEADYIKKLSGVESIDFCADKSGISGKTVSLFGGFGEIVVPLGELVDIDKEIENLNKELEKTNSEIKRSEGLLANAGFTSKAPRALIEKEEQKLQANKEKAQKLQAQLDSMKN